MKMPTQLISTHSCVVLGPAGTGKTTLVNHLAGARFHAGPQADDKTLEAQSCALRLPKNSKVSFVLIDTPGWSHETSTDIKEEYKKVLKEKQLVSEHTPHIILFCVSVSNIRQFQDREAARMSDRLHELKFDQRFPIKVVPVATFGDTQQPAKIDELKSTVKALATKAFKDTGAQVEEPACTMFPPHGQAKGVEELKDQLSGVLDEQIRSPEFQSLWQLAFATSVEAATREHCESHPDNDSALRLFKSAFCTVAAACGKEVDVGSFNEMTAEFEEPPWWVIREIPTEKLTWRLVRSFNPAMLLGLTTFAWLCNWTKLCVAFVALAAVCFMVVLFWRPRYGCHMCTTWLQSLKRQQSQLQTGLRRMQRLRARHLAIMLLFVALILVWAELNHEVATTLMLRGQLDQAKHELKTTQGKLHHVKHELNTAKHELNTAKHELNTTQGKLDHKKQELNTTQGNLNDMNEKYKKYMCAWKKRELRGQCQGLKSMDLVHTAETCEEVCCQAGKDSCSTWQYSADEGCWVGKPSSCDGTTDGSWLGRDRK
ncbi:unnamed protein product [Effrenium voratum]|nr:unnamed protein product [Effrenium voratum]